MKVFSRKFLYKLLLSVLYKIPTLLGVTFIVYFFMCLSTAKGALNTDFATAGAFFSKVFSGYFSWLLAVLKGDLGVAIRDNRPVLEHILERLPATLELNVLTVVVSLAAGIPLGIISASRYRTFLDRMIEITTFVLFSMPAFWLGLVLIILCGIMVPDITHKLFGVKIGLPLSQMQSLEIMLEPDRFPWYERLYDHMLHLVLPVITSSIFTFASISRFARAELIEILHRDYITSARSKGISETKVLYKHALKNALLPIITIVGFMIPSLIGSSFIIETVFAWPGIGRFGYQAIFARDYNAVMALSLFVAVLTLIANSMVDIVYSVIDPRISDEREENALY